MAANMKVRGAGGDQTSGFVGEAHELRWFLLPSEAIDLYKRRVKSENIKPSPFTIRQRIPSGRAGPVVDVDEEVVRLLKSIVNWDGPNKMTIKPKTIEAAVETKAAQSSKKTKKALADLDVPVPKKFPKLAEDSKKTQECTDEVCLPCMAPRLTKATDNESKQEEKEEEKKKRKAIHPPRQLLRKVGDAIEDFDMIKNGDKVLIGLSGGKDSLTLLHCLLQYKYIAKVQRNIEFTVGALTVDPQVQSYDPSSLVPYLAELGVEYLYEEVPIFANASKLKDLRSICAYCSRMKRGIMYTAMRREGWNVLALGQHLDDCAESFLMSAFHNSQLFTMKANYLNKEGDIRIIRPLVYVRETETRKFAESNKLPIVPENCPACFSEPKERNRMKQLLAQQEILHPSIFHSLKRAMRPLFAMQVDEHWNTGSSSKSGNNGKRKRKEERAKENGDHLVKMDE